MLATSFDLTNFYGEFMKSKLGLTAVLLSLSALTHANNASNETVDPSKALTTQPLSDKSIPTTIAAMGPNWEACMNGRIGRFSPRCN